MQYFTAHCPSKHHREQPASMCASVIVKTERHLGRTLLMCKERALNPPHLARLLSAPLCLHLLPLPLNILCCHCLARSRRWWAACIAGRATTRLLTIMHPSRVMVPMGVTPSPTTPVITPARPLTIPTNTPVIPVVFPSGPVAPTSPLILVPHAWGRPARHLVQTGPSRPTPAPTPGPAAVLIWPRAPPPRWRWPTWARRSAGTWRSPTPPAPVLSARGGGGHVAPPPALTLAAGGWGWLCLVPTAPTA